MNRTKFFAVLHFARHLKKYDKELRQIVLKAFNYGYESGWVGRGTPNLEAIHEKG